MQHLRRKHDRGDTIIEVLIAITILSVVLASSFTLMSRAARLNQGAKEQLQAIGYVQQQSELIRASASKDWSAFQVAMANPLNRGDQLSAGGDHFDPNSAHWDLTSGAYKPAPGSAADYSVWYEAEIVCPGLLPGACPAEDIKQVIFHVYAEWNPINPIFTPGGDIILNSTGQVIKVSGASSTNGTN